MSGAREELSATEAWKAILQHCEAGTGDRVSLSGA